jgi:hypothetical protein
MSDSITTPTVPTPAITATTHVTIPIEDFISQIKAASTTVVTDTTSTFLAHVKTWTFVILAIALIGFLYVHESNSNAAANAQAAEVVKQGATAQANIDKQITALHEDTKTQVAAIAQQRNAALSVAQTIAAIKLNVPPVTITPIITQPATTTTPAQTTATEKAAGSTPVATISGDDLKTLADETYTCKAQAVELNSCKATHDLDVQKAASLQTEVTTLQKIKIEPAWKKTIKTIGQILIGAAIGRAL